jgi:hypothetical protein
MADTRDLKSLGPYGPCRFESGLRHQLTSGMDIRTKWQNRQGVLPYCAGLRACFSDYHDRVIRS